MIPGFDRAQQQYDNMEAPEFYYDEREIDCHCPECGLEATVTISFDTRIKYAEDESEIDEKCFDCDCYLERS